MERDNKFWKEISDKYLNDNISLTKLSKEYKIDRRTLSSHLKQMGITIVNRQNRCKFNETVFDNIDTEEKAYWLGFIFADGYISSLKAKYRNVFELSLSIKDLEHIKKFNSFMEYDGENIYLDDHRCRWSVMNEHLWNTLNSYKCTPNKSLTLEFPNLNIFSNKELIKHFIRGYFDGDGCISFHKYIHCVSPVISVIGTKNFLENILLFSNTTSNFRHDKRHSEQTFSLEFNKNNGVSFINYLYSDSNIYLQRKYNKYLFFKNGSRSIQEWNELLSTKNGEFCDENTVVTEEIKESSVPYSVETETAKTE